MSNEHDHRITLEHGSGGALSRELVDEVIYPIFGGDAYPELTDATRVSISGDICMTTDTYTVDPPRFPGSDIGHLAVFGTCNDLAVAGAQPRFLSMGLVLEEGFPIDELRLLLQSMKKAATEARVSIITGDTKVVPAGKGGGIYINTAGIGQVVAEAPISPRSIRAGDSVIVSGPIGAHGIAVLAARERLTVGATIESDCSFLYPACRALMELGSELRFMRDATRGGIAAVVGETADSAQLGIELTETAFPVDPAVRTVAEILGLDPLEIANEGVFVAVIDAAAAPRALELLHATPVGRSAELVGHVTADHPGTVVLETEIGGRRVLALPRGLLLPRIC